jgi:ATP-dependent Clp protease protease subunit
MVQFAEATMNYRFMILIAVLAAAMQGCYTVDQPDQTISPADTRVDFNDPVLNHRQILLFGPLDQQAAEITIQKLLFLDAKSHDPIDLYLQTPGGQIKHGMAIEEIIRIIKSPVNTYALSECNSGGAMLLAAGTGKRHAFHGAIIILHGLKVSGTPPAGFIDLIQGAYTDFWRKHSKLPEAWLPLPFNIIHVLSAEQALEYGIVDEVVAR